MTPRELVPPDDPIAGCWACLLTQNVDARPIEASAIATLPGDNPRPRDSQCKGVDCDVASKGSVIPYQSGLTGPVT